MMVSIEILHNTQTNKQTHGDIYNMMVCIEILHNTNKQTNRRRYLQHDGQYRNIT